MLTNPNTLGLFESDIVEIARIVHEAGGLLYYDGANLNAIMGIARPGDMGFDVVHINLHKTFSHAARRRRAGRGPGRRDRARSQPYLPRPVVGARRRPRICSTTTGRSRSARSAASTATSACSCAPTPTCARSGADGLREVAENAVLNANYLRSRLRGAYELPFDRTCMHEFVLSARELKKRDGVRDARRRQAPAGLRLPPAHDLLPADDRGGAHDRAHRDRGASRRSTRSPTRCCRSRRRPGRTRRASRTRPGRHRSAASTRRGP